MVPVFEQVLKEFPNDVKLVFKNFPLQSHKFSITAARAAMSAYKQGKFWEFHDLLFKNYKSLNNEKINDIAKVIGLDIKEYEKMKKNPEILGKISEDISQGYKAGVRGTPTIFINGKKLNNRSFEGFKEKINKILEK
jgi:protein-disulfide isomerase